MAANKVEPLHYTDVPKTVSSVRRAFSNDPLKVYQFDPTDANKFPHRYAEKIGYLTNSVMFLKAAYDRCAWTVNHGDALVINGPAPSTRPERPVDLLYNSVKRLLGAFYKLFASPEQTRRYAEVMDGLKTHVEECFGDELKDMVCLEVLAVAPEQQGHGYGFSLARVITSKADAESRRTWLISSNIINTAFYESLGFRVVKEVAFGAENPTWTKPPVIACIMVREPEKTLASYEKM